MRRAFSQYIGNRQVKNALVMPFIQALGYDIFDPSEVIPELKKLTKNSFELEKMLLSANDLKYTREIKNGLASDQVSFLRGTCTVRSMQRSNPLFRIYFTQIESTTINKFS
jgi:hypothetical protein